VYFAPQLEHELAGRIFFFRESYHEVLAGRMILKKWRTDSVQVGSRNDSTNVVAA